MKQTSEMKIGGNWDDGTSERGAKQPEHGAAHRCPPEGRKRDCRESLRFSQPNGAGALTGSQGDCLLSISHRSTSDHDGLRSPRKDVQPQGHAQRDDKEERGIREADRSKG